MRQIITSWPKLDQYWAVSSIIRPVTQTAEVAVKTAVSKGACPERTEIGSISKIVPIEIIPKKLSRII